MDRQILRLGDSQAGKQADTLVPVDSLPELADSLLVLDNHLEQAGSLLAALADNHLPEDNSMQLGLD